MSIPSVMQGLVKTEEDNVFELDSQKGSTWLESITSFRYEPTGGNKNYTVRKEAGKGGHYWYGYRTVEKKVHKRYIGRTTDLTVARLEEIAEALNTPPTPRVASKNTEIITDKAVCSSDNDELTVLKQQMQVMQETLEALQEVVFEKYRAINTAELPKPETENTYSELHIHIGNLEAENEALRQELAGEIEKHLAQFASRKQLQTQLEAMQAENKRWEEAFNELQCERDDLEQVLTETKQQYSTLLPNLNQELASVRSQLEAVQVELETCKQQPATESEPLKAPELLNRLKAKRRKVTASLADVEAILGMMGR